MTDDPRAAAGRPAPRQGARRLEKHPDPEGPAATPQEQAKAEQAQPDHVGRHRQRGSVRFTSEGEQQTDDDA